MPRRSRLDSPGAVHHVMARGIDRQAVFVDDDDRESWLRLAAEALHGDGARCLAWALTTNHFHLVVQTAEVALSGTMQRLLGNYAQSFNLRHGRPGPLFQGRFKSVLVEAEAYFCELVRYVHLNPVRAGVVEDLEGLAAFRWTGHRELVGRSPGVLIDVETTLGWFGESRRGQRRTLDEWMLAGLGTPGVRAARGVGDGFADPGLPGEGAGDAAGRPAVLGTAAFEAAALADAEHSHAHRVGLAARGWTLARLTDEVCSALGVEARDVTEGRRTVRASEARAAVASLAKSELGLTGAEIAVALGVSQPAISRALTRGRRIVAERALSLGPDGVLAVS